MRISDWSSDVCSSDLRSVFHHQLDTGQVGHHRHLHRFPGRSLDGPLLYYFRQRVARHSLCRHYLAGWLANYFAGTVRGCIYRRRDALAAIPLCDIALVDPAYRCGHEVLAAFLVYRLPSYLCAYAWRPYERHPPAEDLVV